MSSLNSEAQKRSPEFFFPLTGGKAAKPVKIQEMGGLQGICASRPLKSAGAGEHCLARDLSATLTREVPYMRFVSERTADWRKAQRLYQVADLSLLIFSN